MLRVKTISSVHIGEDHVGGGVTLTSKEFSEDTLRSLMAQGVAIEVTAKGTPKRGRKKVERTAKG